ESFARELEARGRARATVTRRLCTIAGFYKYAVEEELLDHSPAAHLRRPRVDYESHAVALDRNEFGALLVAGLGPPSEHALIALLALNGLRVSEATGADIEHLGLERRLEQLCLAVSAGGQSFCCRRSVLPGDAPRSQGEREPIWRRALRPLLVARRFVLCLPPTNQAPREHHERHPGSKSNIRQP